VPIGDLTLAQLDEANKQLQKAYGT